MLSLGKRLHKTVLLGMIPLAVFSGIPATACYCANGNLRLVCGGQYAAVRADWPQCGSAFAKPEQSSCCQHAHQAADAPGSAVDCSQSGHDSPQPVGKCCKEISKVLTTTVASATLPAIDWQVFAVVPAEIVTSHVRLSLRNAELERVDSGPPIDLVITLHAILI